MKRILVIEDDAQLRLGLKDNLEVEGYHVLTAVDGESGVRAVTTEHPDVVVLDVMLPGMNGFDVCRAIRARGITTPVLMLTARGHETDKVLGLELGADDYVTKPFSIQELLARIRALLRRAAGQSGIGETFRFGDVEIHFVREQAWHARRERQAAVA